MGTTIKGQEEGFSLAMGELSKMPMRINKLLFIVLETSHKLIGLG
jgi:hypothetical protein